ncbi:unnamed protein product [Urochloa humidicola]
MLPDDVLADALSRLAPRGLAASRSVCTAWREIIDARRLLRADLLPLSLAGLFVNYVAPEYDFAKLFSPGGPTQRSPSPSSPTTIPQPQYRGYVVVVISRFSDQLSVGIELSRP